MMEESLKILRKYFAEKIKPQIINLSTMITSLQKANDECVMDNIIRAENAITVLEAGHWETVCLWLWP